MYWRHWKKGILAGLGLSGLLTPAARPAAGSTSLVEASPFLPASPHKTPAPAVSPPALELRGMVVEGDATWLTFYNPSSKTWTTLRPGERDGAVAVKTCNPGDGSVVLELNGQMLTLSLASKRSGFSHRPAVAAAPRPPPQRPRAPMVASLSPAEAHRLELVASVIRQRVEAEKRKRLGPGADT
jgi:hypothetical protein